MKRIFFGVALLMLSCFSSCKKDIPSDVIGTSQRSAGDKDLDLLGHGYNALGRFANEQEGKGLVIDVKKIRSEQANRIEVGTLSYQNFNVNSAEDSRTYIKNILTKINIDARYLLFSSTLRSTFTDYDSTETTYSYASVDKLVITKKLAIIMGLDEIKSNYLSANFLSDCETMSPQDIIKYYGTHVLRDITLGGKISATYRSQISSSDKKHKVEIGVKAGVFKVFGLGMSVGGGTNINESELTENKNQTLTYSAVGGNPSINIAGTVNLAPGTTTPTIDLTAWQNSVDLDNSHLIDIAQDGLIPIYELVPGYKGVLVKEYFMRNVNKLKLGLDYFNVGDFIYHNNWLSGQYFLFLNFPDEIKIVGVSDHEASIGTVSGVSQSAINKQYLNKFEISGDENVTHHLYDEFIGIVPYNYLGGNFNSDEYLLASNRWSQILSDKNYTTTMSQWKPNIYPQKDWGIDLVQVTSTNKYYVRWRQYTKANANDYQNFIEKLYPIADADIARYGFSKQYLKQISSTGTATIGKSF
ncbi:MAC/perforin domain-containing protein [Sphingobacterium siyangense]